MKRDDVFAEVTIFAKRRGRMALTVQGRDSLVEWLRITANIIEASPCGYDSWNQPKSSYRLSWVK